jgi:hypothetical protein
MKSKGTFPGFVIFTSEAACFSYSSFNFCSYLESQFRFRVSKVESVYLTIKACFSFSVLNELRVEV